MEVQKLIKKKHKALKENNKSLVFSVCTDLTNLYMAQEQYHLAIEEYKELAEFEKGDDLSVARINRGLGEAYLALRDFKTALRHQQTYLNIAQKVNNELEEQRALATLGHTYLTKYLDETEAPLKDDLNFAYKYFMKSLMVCENLTGKIGKYEHADMTSRIFSNLGVVHESLGNFDKGVELLKKSITVCKTNDVYEQLQRSYTSLASIYEKKGEYNNAIQHYNLAIEVTKKLRDKSPLCSSLLSKADIFIKLGDFSASKNCLYKAYKNRSNNRVEREIIENKLRVVAAICITQKDILKTNDKNFNELKTLYEKMGDGACFLKNFVKAIEYYHKMLEAAENAGADNQTLATCYFSLAETYQDNKQYVEALSYYEKEYDLCSDVKGSLNTLLKMAECAKSSDVSVDEVKSIYEKGIAKCRETGCEKIEGRFLAQYVNYLRRKGLHSDASHFQEQMKLVSYLSDGTESEDNDSQDIPNIGEDISLDNISGVSDISDDEENETNKQSRRKNRAYVIKRNLKGETALHTACISGNLPVVRHLIELGHPVNVRDNCGWLPLHEAAIAGHVDVVGLLLDKGAAINDRGGIHCNGITPLHDAASNGHLEVVELLLDRGASVVSKSDDGDLPLHYLQQWYSTQQLSSDEVLKYQSIIKRMSQAIEKSGQKIANKSMKKAQTSDDTVPPRRASEIRNQERNRRLSGMVSCSESSESEMETDATDEYRNVMLNIRHKKNISAVKTDKENLKHPALIESDNVDEWLIDDIQANRTNKRRKTSSDSYINTSHHRKSTEISPRCSISSADRSPVAETPQRRPVKESPVKRITSQTIEKEKSYRAQSLHSPVSIDLTMSDHAQRRKSNTGSQMSLLQSGFSRRTQSSPVENASASSFSNSKIRKPKTHQVKLPHAFGNIQNYTEADSTTDTPVDNRNSTPNHLLSNELQFTDVVQDPTLSVDVRIESRLYRVPILKSQIHTKTIKWLAEEAATRYMKKEFIKPVLELQTITGAILADEDLLSLLFSTGTGGVQAEQIEGRVLEWNVPSITERYKEACNNSKTDPVPSLIEDLQALSVSLDISNRAFEGACLVPLCKALNRQLNLMEINFSGNYLSVECIRLLGTTLTSLKNLNLLDLSYCGLQIEHIQTLANTVSLSGDGTSNLQHLKLSHNYLGDFSIKHLKMLLSNLRLCSLELADVNFTSDIFKCTGNEDLSLPMTSLQELVLSDNKLDSTSIERFLKCTNCERLQVLKISRNMFHREIMRKVAEFFPDTNVALSTLFASRCDVEDSVLFDLLRKSDLELKELNLSYNPQLTGITLRRLFGNKSLTHVDLTGCENILQYFDSSCLSTRGNCNLKSLKIFINNENSIEYENLISFWKICHGDKGVVNYKPNLLHLLVEE